MPRSISTVYQTSHSYFSSQAKNRTSDKTIALNLEVVITILFILYFSQAFFTFPAINKFFAVVTYIPLPYIIFKTFNRYLYFSTRDIFILCLIALASASLFWSPLPMYSFNHFRGMFRLAAYGIYFAMKYSLKDQIKLLALAFGISSLAGLFLSIAAPSIGMSEGFWKGSFPTKNDAARVMILSLISQAAVILNTTKKASKFTYVATVSSFILLLFARSSTSLVVLTVMILLYPMVVSLRQRSKVRMAILVPIILLLVFGGTAIIENYELIIVDVLGKDLTLNGRTDLWEPLFQRIREKPLLGFGYNVFWETEFEWVAANKLYGDAWTPTHAHSGFLDITLSLGIIGLALFSMSFLALIFKSLKLSILLSKTETLWTLQFLVLVFIYNLNITQSILAPENIIWAMYMSTAATLSASSRRRELYS